MSLAIRGSIHEANPYVGNKENSIRQIQILDAFKQNGWAAGSQLTFENLLAFLSKNVDERYLKEKNKEYLAYAFDMIDTNRDGKVSAYFV